MDKKDMDMNANMNRTGRHAGKAVLLTALLGSLFLSPAALARHQEHESHTGSFVDRARVIERVPVYEEIVTPRQSCWTEEVAYESPRGRSYAGAVIGGLTGAILGNQVGKGDGRKAAIAVGAATGAIVGDNIDNDGHAYGSRDARHRERCRMVEDSERRLTGYNVTYRYQGREYTTFLPYDPGNSVRVQVRVSLAD